MSEHETLRPCPFCGRSAEYDSQRWVPPSRYGFKSATGHAITCSKCEAQVGLFESYEEAAAAWNMRILSPGSDSSPAATDAMERARKVLTEFRQCKGFSATKFKSTEDHLEHLVAAAINSAVEQERQACALLVAREMHDNYSSHAAGSYKWLCDAIRSRSAEPPDTKGGE